MLDESLRGSHLVEVLCCLLRGLQACVLTLRDDAVAGVAVLPWTG
jgi:hypothetical protein